MHPLFSVTSSLVGQQDRPVTTSYTCTCFSQSLFFSSIFKFLIYIQSALLKVSGVVVRASDLELTDLSWIELDSQSTRLKLFRFNPLKQVNFFLFLFTLKLNNITSTKIRNIVTIYQLIAGH